MHNFKNSQKTMMIFSSKVWNAPSLISEVVLYDDAINSHHRVTKVRY